MNEAQLIPKFGYAPLSFPRDPVEVNQFAEHVILGQILVPLVETDSEGNIVPGVAQAWTFSDGGLRITFQLDPRYRFDDGTPILAKDVKYSLERHFNSSSQSKNFLRSISKITVISDQQIEIQLSEQDPAVIKALSRDQLGIVPEDWTFEATSLRPFRASGAYTLVKEDNSWFLEKNGHFPFSTEVAVPKWKVLSYTSNKYDLPQSESPDVVLFASDEILADFKSSFKGILNDYQIEPIPSFLQTSAWSYPHSQRPLSEKRKAIALISEILQSALAESDLEPATGVIPNGVAGHLTSPVEVDLGPALTKDSLKVALVGRVYDFIFDSPKTQKILADRQVTIHRIYTSGPELSALKEQKPDIIFAAWAGGFNDPDGFLPLLSSILQVDLETFFAEVSSVYKVARVESDWTERSRLFRQFNGDLVKKAHMIPGWKIPTYAIVRRSFNNAKKGFRYTPRLSTVTRN